MTLKLGTYDRVSQRFSVPKNRQKKEAGYIS